MILYAFGDSWTEGVGGDLGEEKKTEIPEERTKIRHLTSWPKYLAEMLEIDFVNMGVGAASNKIIFDCVVSLVKNDTIKTNDLVIIMWSSPLREEVPFFPKNEWHFWGERYKSKEHIFKFILKNSEIKNLKYRKFEKEYKEFYMDEVYDESYYNIINQNYLIFLQFLFDKMGINYLFCDAFDNMISKNIIEEINKTKLICKKKYWRFMESTLRDFLIEKGIKDVWEDNIQFTERYAGKHPNKKGYKIIAEELHSWIIENNLIENKKDSYINII